MIVAAQPLQMMGTVSLKSWPRQAIRRAGMAWND
jgi:hypothetical protein